jgi:hypothetical protein
MESTSDLGHWARGGLLQPTIATVSLKSSKWRKDPGGHDSCCLLYIEENPVLAKSFMSASASSAWIRNVLVLSSPPPFTNNSKSLQIGARRFRDFGPIRCISNLTDTGLRLAQVLTDLGTTMIRHSGRVRRTGTGSVASLEGCKLGPSSIILFENL